MELKTDKNGSVIVNEKKNILRRLYDWVLHWAETPYGAWALFIIAFAESSFFPIPPDILLIALAISIPIKSFKYGLICVAGSILGGILGYGIGYFGYETVGVKIVEFYNGQDIMAALKDKYDTYGFWGVLSAALTPIPYKIFTISSGFFKFDFVQFLSASILGRSLRFMIIAGLIYKFGAPIKIFIDKYFNILAIIFLILLAGGFIVIKYLL